MPVESEQFKKAREYAYLLLKFRPRSISEFREKLIRHGFGEDVTAEVISDFKRRGLLDDAKFARLWVQDRMHLKPMGRLKLKLELAAKGVDEVNIDEALNGSSAQTDEYEVAYQAAQKRLTHMGKLDKLTLKRRLFEFLKRRGFSYEAIAKAVKESVDDSRHNP